MKILLQENVRILVVDDDASIIDSYRKVLSEKENDELQLGLVSMAGRLFEEPLEPKMPSSPRFNLEVSTSGERARDLVAASVSAGEPYAVVFLDYTLPGINGVETAAEIRRLDPSVEIVLVTGRSDLNVEKLSQEVPPLNKFFYFQKPFNSGELRHLTRALTEKWKVERELEALKNNLENLVIQRTQELTQTNINLEKAKNAAEIAVQAKRDFLATMSHEMRTPLNAILGFAELTSTLEIPFEVREYMKNIHVAGHELLQIITDILDFTRLGQGNVKFDSERVNIAELVLAIKNQFSELAASSQLALTTKIESGCVDAVQASPWGLRRVLAILVSNAIKFTRTGGATIRVSAAPNREGRSCIKFTVEDTGIGISRDEQKTIFSAFSQADSSITRSYDGIGLGLAICKQVFNGMNCQFGFESELNRGSQFWFMLPISGPTELNGAAGNLDEHHGAIQHSITAEDSNTGSAVLVVEDNLTNQLIMVNVVKHHGYTADLAGDGAKALNAVKLNDYKLIFMDCQMPEMDGIEATRAIREAGITSDKTAIIGITANVDEETRKACLEAGMDEYISKPVDVKQIKRLMEQFGLMEKSA